MAYETSVHAQDSRVGRVGVVLDSLVEASHGAGKYDYVDVAVAYASHHGVRMLNDKLDSPSWPKAHKRFLVSIDFGFTQPEALIYLSSLENAEVRIPNGRAVLADPSLRPPFAFHAKSYAFRTEEGDNPQTLRALVVGSANLTASALSTGAEVVTKQIWSGHASTDEWHQLMQAKQFLNWFEDAWLSADLFSDVIAEYQQRHDALPEPRLPEDSTVATQRYLASPTTPMSLVDHCQSSWPRLRLCGSTDLPSSAIVRPGLATNSTPLAEPESFLVSALRTSRETPLLAWWISEYRDTPISTVPCASQITVWISLVYQFRKKTGWKRTRGQS